MDLNSNKKIKLTNSSLENVDEFHSDTKLINKLNHYCLSKVLMYLPVLDRLEMEQVCEKWKYTAESSWYNVKKLDFNDLMITLDKKEEITKTIIIRCGRYLRYLKIIHEQYPWMCDVFKNNCQNIIHFDINMVRIEYEDKYKICDRDLVEIISSMPKLKYLRVSMNYRQDSRLPYQRIINSLPENMQEIHLSVQAEEGDEYNEVAPVLNKFNALRCLRLVGFCLRNSTMEEILKNKNTLVKLELSYCDFPSNVSETGVTVKTLVHAVNRQFVFTSLRIDINSAVRMEYAEEYIFTSSSPSPYLIIY